MGEDACGIPRLKVLRMFDANLNRAIEGARVCEDYFRFIADDENRMRILRAVRHRLSDTKKSIDYTELVSARSASEDSGKELFADESSRKDAGAMLIANYQRMKEAARSLEEVSKLIHPHLTDEFKNIRFRLYEIEQEIICG